MCVLPGVGWLEADGVFVAPALALLAALGLRSAIVACNWTCLHGEKIVACWWRVPVVVEDKLRAKDCLGIARPIKPLL